MILRPFCMRVYIGIMFIGRIVRQWVSYFCHFSKSVLIVLCVSSYPLVRFKYSCVLYCILFSFGMVDFSLNSTFIRRIWLGKWGNTVNFTIGVTNSQNIFSIKNCLFYWCFMCLISLSFSLLIFRKYQAQNTA